MQDPGIGTSNGQDNLNIFFVDYQAGVQAVFSTKDPSPVTFRDQSQKKSQKKLDYRNGM